MHDLGMAAYLVTAIGLFSAPLVAFGAYAAIQSRWPSRQSTIAAMCALVLVLILGAAALGFSFKDVMPNFVAFIIAYAAYCFLAVSCLRIRWLFIRILALIVAAIPICIGYVFCTIGSLGIMFFVGDYTNPPKQVEQLRPDLTCRVTLWGASFTASGYAVHLYKTWAWLPLIEKSVVTMSVNQTDFSEGQAPKDLTCVDALAKYLE
jgi:glucan phosphoethanolaminetransferase (alkaline phosphatase superfamily)